MEKIKEALHIGNHKEHGHEHGTSTTDPAATGRKSSVTEEIATSEETKAQRAADRNPHESRNLIARQLFNPGGDKYSAEQYGTPADGIPVPSSQLEAETAEQRAQDTRADESSHLVARQILNPGGDKYNPEQYGTPADNHPTGATQTTGTTGGYNGATSASGTTANPTGATHTTGTTGSSVGATSASGTTADTTGVAGISTTTNTGV